MNKISRHISCSLYRELSFVACYNGNNGLMMKGRNYNEQKRIKHIPP